MLVTELLLKHFIEAVGLNVNMTIDLELSHLEIYIKKFIRDAHTDSYTIMYL